MRAKRKGKIEIAQLLNQFQKTILEKRPSFNEMFEEVRMMHFKIRPLQGDISRLQTLDARLVEALWNIGKFDEFFKSQRSKLTKGEQDMFLRYFETLHSRLQKEVSSVTQSTSQQTEDGTAASIVEMEIYREGVSKKHIN